MTPTMTMLAVFALTLPSQAWAQGTSPVDDNPPGAAIDYDGYAPKRARTRNQDRARLYLPPMRFGMRTGIRDGINPSFLLEFGVQVTRSDRVKLDTNVSFAVPHGLRLGRLFRTMSELDFTADVLWVTGPRLEIGPTLGASVRWFYQQWTTIDNAVVPVAGLRVSTPLLRARKWSWELDLRGRVDLGRTEFVLETQQIVPLSPWEAQIGMRFNFGYGRRPGVATL